MDIFIEVIKWIGIVVAAGFVGYFGRYLAMLIIDKIHAKQSGQSSAKEQFQCSSINPESKLEERRLKIDKKRAKSKAKYLKKAKYK